MKRSRSILRATSKRRRNYWWLSETELERSQTATYYGVILAGSGDFERGAKFLDLEAKADLLAEERQLVEKAQLTIARR